MRLNLSEEWYAREFRKDAEEPVMSAAAGRVNAPIAFETQTEAQEEEKRVHETISPSTPSPPKNAP